MEKENIVYEQLNDGREFFRYKSCKFTYAGIDIGDEHVVYHEEIMRSHHAQLFIQWILSARIIFDTYTLRIFIHRLAICINRGLSFESIIPKSVIQEFPSNEILTSGLIAEFLPNEEYNLTKANLSGIISSIESLKLAIRVGEFKTRFLQIVVGEFNTWDRERETAKVLEARLKEKTIGIFRQMFADFLVNGQVTESARDLIKNEVDSGLLMLFKTYGRNRVEKHAQQIMMDRTMVFRSSKCIYGAAIVNPYNTVRFGDRYYFDRDSSALPEIYGYFTSCPFPDEAVLLSNLKCPVTHSEASEH